MKKVPDVFGGEAVNNGFAVKFGTNPHHQFRFRVSLWCETVPQKRRIGAFAGQIKAQRFYRCETVPKNATNRSVRYFLPIMLSHKKAIYLSCQTMHYMVSLYINLNLLVYMKADKISNKSIIFRLTPFLRATAFITLVAFIFTCVPADMVSASTASHVPERQIYESLDQSSFTLPLELGIVKDSWSHAPDSNSPVTTVIHIQDAHCNYAAQKKIAEIIAYLGREYGVDSVNL